MLNALLENFPIRKYGMIALAFVCPLFILYYHFAYHPFLETNQTFEINCDFSIDKGIELSISAPIFVTNETDINIVVANTSPENIENIKITVLPSNQQFSRFTSIKFEPVNIENLGAGTNENKVSKLTIYGMRDDSEIMIEGIYVDFGNHLTKCKGSIDLVRYRFTTYNQLGSWLLSVVGNVLAATGVLLLLSAISCLAMEDENQDFRPTSRIGTYYIARTFFRASIPLALFFIALHWVTSEMLGIWKNNYVPYVAALIGYILVSLAAIKILTRLIRVRPKTRIIINSSGKEKEIELMEQPTEFNLQKFLVKISKTKKR